MEAKHLDWDRISWADFQQLCIEIGNEYFSDCDFSEHLKPGQKQDGIDLLSFSKIREKFVPIQCKKEKKLTIADIKKILDEFEENKYSPLSSDFVVATTANLQNRELKLFIDTQTERIYREKKILFQCWDKYRLEELLRPRWDIVERYFGSQAATEFCYPRIDHTELQSISEVPDYIDRKIAAFDVRNDEDFMYRMINPIRAIELSSLIPDDLLEPAHICLVSDPYQGKSSLLRQTAFLLQQQQSSLYPVFIDIKEHSVQPIEHILNTYHSAWRKIPGKNLLLIIDGLDETPSEKLIDMVEQIRDFIQSHRSISVIISCRKLFYNKYGLAKSLKNFATYQMYPLDHEDIIFYLDRKLGSLRPGFDKAITLSQSWPLLYQPFYLVHIVADFLKSPGQAPKGRLAIINDMIARSMDQSKLRRTRGSEAVKDEMVIFRSVMEKFALALQLAGTNSMEDEEMQKLFSKEERFLLEHNALVSHSGQSWSFVGALFQEHLAAVHLSKMSFEEIVAFCTVGKKIRKIKMKWMQTISSLLSFLDVNDGLHQSLLKLIEEDNIELLFHTDGAKYNDDLKLTLLKKLVDKCSQLNTRPQIVDEGTVGFFISSSVKCRQYLLDCLTNESTTDRMKTVFCKMLRTSSLSNSQLTKYIDFAKKELAGTTDAYNAGQMIQVLAQHKAGDKALVEQFISLEKLNDYHDFRDKMYEWINVLGLVDIFYSYGLNGLPYLVKHNKGIHHGGSEHNLEDFLLETNKPGNLKLLLLKFCEEEWLSYYEWHRISRKDFLDKIFDKMAIAYSSEPRLAFAVAKFIRSIGKKYLREDFRQVDAFLEKTNAYGLVMRILLNEIFDDQDWQIGSLITADNYDYLLFEYEHGDYPISHLRSCFSGLRYYRKDEMADTFYQLCIDLTEGEILDKDSSKYQAYLDAEAKKYSNDLVCIKSLAAFKKAVRNYFKAYGEIAIPQQDLYINIDSNRGSIRAQTDSHFVYYFLTRWHNDPVIYLDACIKKLSEPFFFENFRAKEISNYHRRDAETDQVLLPILEKYYRDNLPQAVFANCMTSKEGMFYFTKRERRLKEIFEKFTFETPEEYLMQFVWMDNDGTRGFETARLNKRKSISEMILDRLSVEGTEKFKKLILTNMESGIDLLGVLGNHIALCKHFKILEAKDIILEHIKEMPEDYTTTKVDAMDIYVELGGDNTELLDIFSSIENCNDYTFFHLAMKLSKIFPEETALITSKALNNEATTPDNKIKFAQILADIGKFEGFAYLANLVRIKRKSPFEHRSGFSVEKIDTAQALKELEDLAYLIIDPEYNHDHSFHDQAKSILLDWLGVFAGKSEADLLLVCEFYDAAKERLKDKYADAADFTWFANRVLEDFRNSDKSSKSIAEIKKILKQIDE